MFLAARRFARHRQNAPKTGDGEQSPAPVLMASSATEARTQTNEESRDKHTEQQEQNGAQRAASVEKRNRPDRHLIAEKRSPNEDGKKRRKTNSTNERDRTGRRERSRETSEEEQEVHVGRAVKRRSTEKEIPAHPGQSKGKATKHVARPTPVEKTKKTDRAFGALQNSPSASRTASAQSEQTRREKAAGVLFRVLSSGDKDPAQVRALADEIEASLCSHFGVGSDGYTNMIKALKFNLESNEELRSDFLHGRVLPKQVPSLTSAQLASRDKAGRKHANFAAAAFQDSVFITAQNSGAATTDFVCEKFQHEHVLPDAFWTTTNEATQLIISCRNCRHQWRE